MIPVRTAELPSRLAVRCDGANSVLRDRGGRSTTEKMAFVRVLRRMRTYRHGGPPVFDDDRVPLAGRFRSTVNRIYSRYVGPCAHNLRVDGQKSHCSAAGDESLSTALRVAVMADGMLVLRRRRRRRRQRSGGGGTVDIGVRTCAAADDSC